MGRRAIAATTVAVEHVVLGHLADQLERLRGKDEAAVRAISAIVAEEQQHHDLSASHMAEDRSGRPCCRRWWPLPPKR